LVDLFEPRYVCLSEEYEGEKTRGCYCSCLAPDYEREDARNMLSWK